MIELSQVTVKSAYSTTGKYLHESGGKTFRCDILLEDSQIAILTQHGQEICRVDFSNPNYIHTLITVFLSYEPKEVKTFSEAIEKFKE